MTVDSWGVLGRLVLEEKGVFSAYYMAIFIFLMTYFFLNVLLAFVVDNMTPSNAPILFQKIEENDEENQSLGEILGRGKIHDWMVNIIFVVSLFQVHNYTKYNDGRGNLAIAFEITNDFICTLSFLSRVNLLQFFFFFYQILRLLMIFVKKIKFIGSLSYQQNSFQDQWHCFLIAFFIFAQI